MRWLSSGILSQSPAASSLLLHLVQSPMTIFLEFLPILILISNLSDCSTLFCFIYLFHIVNFTKKKKKINQLLFFSSWHFSLYIFLEHSSTWLFLSLLFSWVQTSLSYPGLPPSFNSHRSSLVCSLNKPSVEYLLTQGTILAPGNAKIMKTLSLSSSSSEARKGDRQVDKLEQDVSCYDTVCM